MLVIIRKKCRTCGEIPPQGFFPSRAKRYDWLCPDCCINIAAVRRKNRLAKELATKKETANVEEPA